MKLVVTILFAMVATLFYYNHDLYVKLKQEELLANLRWQAQAEVLTLHAKTLNQQSDIIVRMAKGDWRTS